MPDERTYAQWGEDKLVWEYFHRKPHGFFVEVGANDPIIISQTYLLEQSGWEGILVEPQPECCKRLRPARPKSKVIQAACGAPEQKGKARFRIASNDGCSLLDGLTTDEDVTFAETVEVDLVTVDDVLAQSGNPKPDFVSIDVEGGELNVLKGFSLAKHKPQLLLMEDHVRDLSVHHYLRRQGYKLVRRTGSNNWYVPEETPFPVSLSERWRLFRKMYLATPLRQLKRAFRRRKDSAPSTGRG